ncbi:MAG: hypothetical protein U9R37_08495, partial [Campylobacterota bacterium]|nr:hypothetical protein [Campylobacterota bacterium]
MRYIQLIFILLILNSSLFAKANLYIFVFKDGVAFKDTKIQVGEHISTTNEYGYTKFELQSDTYEISYFKDEKLFALSEANIVDDQDSQVFLNITNDKAEVELDLPLEAYDQDFKKVDIKKLEGPKGTIELK